MGFEHVIQIVQTAALLALVAMMYSGKLRGERGDRGEPGAAGPRGEKGDHGVQGPPGVVHVSHQDDAIGGTTRYEMLKDGKATGHFLTEESRDFQEAFNTPGLSVRAFDGTVIEGVQNGPTK